MSASRPGDQDRLLRRIVQLARRQGYLSFHRLVCMFPTEATAEETRQLVDKLQELGIKVRYDTAERDPALDTARRTDPGLLTRDQEVDLARRIRDGQRRRIRAALRCPNTVQAVIRAAQQVAAGHRRLWDVLSDFEGSHPDEDDQEARERLMVVAESLRRNQTELNRLQSPQAVRKQRPGRSQRIASLRSAMIRTMGRLDFQDAFIAQLLKPMNAEAARVRRARDRLAALERELGLARGAFGDLAPLADERLRALLRGAELDRSRSEQASRQVKKLKRAMRSASVKTGMQPADLLEAVREVRRGERQANEARQALVEANQRLVISIARRYPHRNMDFLDLVQEGNLGLMRAADRFDPERGFRFGTYAAWWVRQSIGRLVAEQGSAVRIPPHVQESLHKVNRITRRLVLKTGKEPTIEELAEQLDKTPERVKEILGAGLRSVSTETQVGNEEDSARLLDFLPDPHAGPEEEADRRVQQAMLQDAMSALTDREQDIIALRFQQGLTLQEVGERYAITRERTRQLEAQALRKLRRRLKADLLRRLIHDGPLQACEEDEPPATGSGRRSRSPGRSRKRSK